MKKKEYIRVEILKELKKIRDVSNEKDALLVREI